MVNRKWGKLILIAAGALLALAALWFVLSQAEELLAGKNTSGQQEAGQASVVQQDARQVHELELGGIAYTYDHDIKTYLLIGTDGRGNMEGEGEAYEGDIADFLLLAVMDETDGSYGFFQIDRDTMTDVNLMRKDGTWDESVLLQICLSFFYGGTPEMSCENTVNAVSGLLGGVPIDGYYALSMENIPRLNHAVGGIEVTIRHDFSQVDPSLVMGETTVLSDEQAFTYVHDRYYVGDESNEERMERQTEYMNAFFEKVQKLTKEDAAFLNTLFNELEDEAVTNINGGQLGRIIEQMNGGESLGILRAEGEHRLERSDVDGVEYMTFYPEEESLIRIMTELYDLRKKGEENDG